MKNKTDFNFPLNLVADESCITGGEFSFPSDFSTHKTHTHESVVLVGIHSGLLGLQVEKDSMVINPETLAFIPRKADHNMMGLGIACQGWFINIPKPYCLDLPQRAQLYSSRSLLYSLGLRITSWDGYCKKHLTIKQKNLLQVFLDELSETEPLMNLGVPVPQENNMNEVVKQFMRDPASKNTIDDWAKMAGVSRRSFTASFREQTGISFCKWKHKVLIQEAIRHLDQGKTVKETASLLGYSSVSSFTERFRKDMKASPKQYLKKKQEKKKK